MTDKIISDSNKQLNLDELDDLVTSHGLFFEAGQADTIKAIDKAITCRAIEAESLQKMIALGGGSGILAMLRPANAINIFVSEWQSSIDDGGSTNVILENFIKRGLGRSYSIGDLVSSLFKGFARQSMVQGILDDQGRIMLAKSSDVEKGIIPEFDSKGESYNSKKIVVFGKQYGLIDDSTGEKNTRDVRYVDTLQQWADLSLARNEEMFAVENEPGFIRFANGLRNLLNRVQPYIDEGIIDLPGASVRNLLVVAALDYLQLIDLTNPRYSKGSDALLTATDEEISRYHYGLVLLAQLVGIRDKAKVGIAHRNPATVYAEFRDLVVTIDHDGEIIVFSIQPALEGAPARIHFHRAGSGTVSYSNEGNRAKLQIQNCEIMVNLTTDESEVFSFQISNDENLDVIDVYDDSRSYVAFESKQYSMCQDGTGLFRFPDENSDVFSYQPLNCANGAKVFVRPRTIFRQTHVTETASYSPIVRDGIAEAIGQERIRNKESGEVSDVTIYRIAADQQLEENPGLLREIESDATKLITIGPGSLFTSVMPYFRTRGVVEALKKRRNRGDIPIKLILNPTIDNESFGYQMLDIVEKIEQVAGVRIGEFVSEISVTRLDVEKLEQYLGQSNSNAKWFMDQINDRPQLVDEVGLEYVRYLEYTYNRRSDGEDYIAGVLDDDGTEIRISGNAINNPTRKQFIEAKIEQLYSSARQVVQPEIRRNASAASVAAKKSRGGLSPLLSEISKIIDSRGVDVVENLVAGISFSQSRIPGEPASPRVVLMDERTRFVLEEDCGKIQHSRIFAGALDNIRQLNKVPEDRSNTKVFMQYKEILREEVLAYESPATVDYFDQLTACSWEQLLNRVSSND